MTPPGAPEDRPPPPRAGIRTFAVHRPPAAATAPSSWQPVAAVLFVVCIGLASWLWLTDPATWSIGAALVAVPLLTFLSFPMFLSARREPVHFDLAGLMAVGLFLRVLGSLYRYDHRADAEVYHDIGVGLADSFRALRFDVDVGAPIPGTGGMRYIGGLVEVLTNNNQYASFLVFTWLGFVGCVLLYRAFVTALPDADHHRYALLIFLWPTMVFWPSSIGKDCWMLFTVGIASLGAARVLARRPGGYTLLFVGLFGGSLVRPHIAILGFIAFALAFLIGRREPSARGGATPAAVAKVAGLVVLLAVGALVADRFSEFLDANDISSVESGVTVNADRTGQGGSEYTAANPQNPLGYVEAGVTILFRPFPFEVSGTEQVVTSAEALFLLGLAIASWRRLVSIPFRLRREPYVAYAGFLVLMLVFVLGTIGNFGILARQRTQVIPFVFVLLSVTVVKAATSKPARSSPSLPARRPR